MVEKSALAARSLEDTLGDESFVVFAARTPEQRAKAQSVKQFLDAEEREAGTRWGDGLGDGQKTARRTCGATLLCRVRHSCHCSRYRC